MLIYLFVIQGDACTSCPPLSAAVGDGVAVPGPKGERGEPGPQGEGKPGRNVTKQCICSFFMHLLLRLMKMPDDWLASSQGKPGLAGPQGPAGPKGSKVRMFMGISNYFKWRHFNVFTRTVVGSLQGDAGLPGYGLPGPQVRLINFNIHIEGCYCHHQRRNLESQKLT